jgi:hypothetical protein
MKKLAATCVAMGGLWLSAMGCSSEEPEPERVPAGEFGARFSRAMCDYVARCCSASDFAFDQVNCEGRTEVWLQGEVDEALTGLADYDEAAAGKCLARLREKPGCSNGVFEFPCREAILGRLEDMQPCTQNSSCKSGLCGQVTAEGSTCVPRQNPSVVAGKEGDSCLDTCEAPGHCPPVGGDGPLTVCYRSEGLFCGAMSDAFGAPLADGRCQRLLKLGQACQETRECSAGFFCQGVCVAPRVNGASCRADSECQSLACADNVCADSDFSEAECTSGGMVF